MRTSRVLCDTHRPEELVFVTLFNKQTPCKGLGSLKRLAPAPCTLRGRETFGCVPFALTVTCVIAQAVHLLIYDM